MNTITEYHVTYSKDQDMWCVTPYIRYHGEWYVLRPAYCYDLCSALTLAQDIALDTAVGSGISSPAANIRVSETLLDMSAIVNHSDKHLREEGCRWDVTELDQSHVPADLWPRADW